MNAKKYKAGEKKLEKLEKHLAVNQSIIEKSNVMSVTKKHI